MSVKMKLLGQSYGDFFNLLLYFLVYKILNLGCEGSKTYFMKMDMGSFTQATILSGFHSHYQPNTIQNGLFKTNIKI